MFHSLLGTLEPVLHGFCQSAVWWGNYLRACVAGQRIEEQGVEVQEAVLTEEETQTSETQSDSSAGYPTKTKGWRQTSPPLTPHSSLITLKPKPDKTQKENYRTVPFCTWM